jgi:D-alanyl-D-alanine carboxypeptidase
MRYYSYRPPRLARNKTVHAGMRKKRLKAGLVFLVAILLVSVLAVGVNIILVLNQDTELKSAVRRNSSQFSTTADRSEDVLVLQLMPFLTTEKSDWQLQQGLWTGVAVGGAAEEVNTVLESKAGLSVNFADGEVYYSYNANTKLPMASTTKIMTAMVALDLASLEERFTVSRSATEVEPTVMGAYEGEQLTNRELIKAAMIMSANDAAQILAEGIGAKYGGDEELFVQAMNEKARILGMENTSFRNPQGYDDPEHYSTCEDLVKMSHYALTNYPEITRIVKQKDEVLEENDFHHKMWLPNWNMLIDTYPGADGVKIGNTGEAGHTTVASATREEVRIMSCVLGAEGILKRDMAAAELLNVGFSKNNIAPYPMDEDLLRTRIRDWY